MTDRELEQRLRAWYEAEVGSTEAAPVGLRESVATIPVTTPAPLRPLSGRRRFTLLAVAALIVVGGALAAGSGFLRVTPVVTPAPSLAAVAPGSPSPTETGPETPSPTVSLRNGATIAFIRNVEEPRSCSSFRKTTTCPTPRLWVVGSDGHGAHELLADGMGRQTLLAWSPDGTRLLYTDDDKLLLTDASGGRPQPVDIGCAPPPPATTPLSCQYDAVAFSSDGRSIVFVRTSTDATGSVGPGLATMDLASGRVSVLNATTPVGVWHPGWSPDGRRIVFFRYGDKDSGGPGPRREGRGLRHRRGRPEPAADQRRVDACPVRRMVARRRPDRLRVTERGATGHLHDAAGRVRRAAVDHGRARRRRRRGWPMGGSCSPAAVAPEAPPRAGGRWTPTARTRPSSCRGRRSVCLAGRPCLHLPGHAADRWTGHRAPAVDAGGATVVGPPAPTPSPTPTPDLAPGFSWTGTRDRRGWDPPRRHGHAARGRARARHRRMQQGSGAVRPGDRHVQPDGLHVGGPLRRDRHAPPRRTRAVRRWLQLRARRRGRDLGIGRAVRPGDRHVQPDRLDGRPTPAAHGHPAGRWPRAHRRRSVGPGPGDGGWGHPRLVSDRRGRRLPGDRRALRPRHRDVQQDRFDEHAPSRPHGDPAPGRARARGGQRWRDQPQQPGRRPLRPGDRQVQQDRADEDGPLAPDRHAAPGRPCADPGWQVAARTRCTPARRCTTRDPARSARPARCAKVVSSRPRPCSRTDASSSPAAYWSDGQKWRDLSSTEMYDPRTGRFSAIGSMGARRDGHTATLLNDGRVLIVGGEAIGNAGGVGVPSAVLYQP